MGAESFPSWPSYSEEEALAVQRVLASNRVNYWTGTECRQFESEFAAWVGTKYSVSLANGTLALELALRALGIGPGDEVIVTPRTFIASVSCVVSVGATPVFADVDYESGNLTAQTIAAVLSSRSRAIICVHLAGWPCDMDPIMALSTKHGLKVIEDCAQAHGALYKGRMVGSIGHVGAWSFCQDKIMTTGGEGGMVTTNDETLWRSMWAYKDHGKSYNAVYERKHPPGFRWLHESFGTNWRMLEIQAAIGRIQLGRMKDWSNQRTVNAKQLRGALEPLSCESGPIRLPRWGCQSDCRREGAETRSEGGTTVNCNNSCAHAWYKFYVYVRPKNLVKGWNRDRIIEAINTLGVPCYHGTCSEVYLEKAFAGTGLRPQRSLPVAKDLGQNSIVLLVHPTLRQSDIEKTVEVVKTVLNAAT